MSDQLLLRIRFVFAAVFALLAIPGCLSDSEDERGPSILPRDPIDNAIEYLELVWRHQLYTEYEQILHDQFEFFPLERDAQDFPWMTGPSWNRAEELNIAEHMFDPDFSGKQSPVDVIEIELTELSRRELGTNHVEVTCTMVGRVLTAANDGWSFDTRVVLEIGPDPDEPGLFQVYKQTEIDAA